MVASLAEETRVVIVTDVRLKTDIPSIQHAVADKASTSGQKIGLFFVRIHCLDEIRQRFGWKFAEAIDGHFTETDLDHYEGTWYCSILPHTVLTDVFQGLSDRQ